MIAAPAWHKVCGLLAAFTAVGAVGFCHSTAWAKPAPAERYALEWSREPGAESCVSGDTLSRMLEQVVGPVLRKPSDASFLIQGLIRREEAPIRWHARIRVFDLQGKVVGEREITESTPQCSAVTPSLLLVMAFIVDPDAVEGGLPAEVTAELSRPPGEPAASGASEAPAAKGAVGTSTSASAPRAVPADSPPARRSRKRESVPGWHVAIAPALGAELLPAATPGATASLLGLLSESWAFDTSAAFFFPATVPVEGFGSLGGGVDLYAAQLSVSLCRALIAGARWQTDGCAGALLGARWANANALQQEDGSLRPYFGPSLGTDTRWFFAGSWFAFGDVTVGLSVRRERFVYTDRDGRTRPLFTPGQVFGWASAGVGLRL